MLRDLLMESIYNKEIPEEIRKLNEELNSYDYGFINNGRRDTNMDNFFENYKSLTVREFKKYKIGVCWDFVHYEANWFKSKGYKYKTFYIQAEDEDGDFPSHTYLVFYLNNIPYYFESSWYDFQGIEKFNNITLLHNTVKRRHLRSAQSKCDPNTYFIEEFDATSKEWEGLSCSEYTYKVTKGRYNFV